jgi:hypothetical protein
MLTTHDDLSSLSNYRISRGDVGYPPPYGAGRKAGAVGGVNAKVDLLTSGRQEARPLKPHFASLDAGSNARAVCHRQSPCIFVLCRALQNRRCRRTWRLGNQHRFGLAERLTFVSGAKRKGSTQTLGSVASCRTLQFNVGLSGFIALKNALMISAARKRWAGCGIV